MENTKNSVTIFEPYQIGVPTSLKGNSFLLIGGWLGAGKTSLALRLRDWLSYGGVSTGLIANGQGHSLVDEVWMRRQGEIITLDVKAVTGGCFRSKADELMAGIQQLQKAGRSNVIIAESAGSCADLAATVLRPMGRTGGIRIAPYAVLVDGMRLLDITDSSSGKGKIKRTAWNADVRYIYDKQLEEAECIVVTKADLLTSRPRQTVARWLAANVSGKPVHVVSSATGEGLEQLFTALMTKSTELLANSSKAMEMDYGRYAAGEAYLGWYSGEFSVHGVTGPNVGNPWLLSVGKALGRAMADAGLTMEHMKLSLVPVHPADGPAAVVQGAGHGAAVGFSQKLSGPVTVGRLLINVRAAGNAWKIQTEVASVLGAGRMSRVARCVKIEEASSEPEKMAPAHRMMSVGL